jgi:hypothetical protein
MTQGKLVGCKVLQYCDVVLNYTTYYLNLWTWTSPLPVNNLLLQPVNMNISSSSEQPTTSTCEHPTTSTCEHEHLLFLWTTYYLNLWTSYYLNLWTWTSPLPVNNLLPQPVNISFCEQLAMPLLLGWSTQITWDSPLCQQVVIPVGM